MFLNDEGMTTSLEKTIEIFKNSKNFTLQHKKINSFYPVKDVREKVFNIFEILRDSDDEYSQRIKLYSWKLLTTIELSILPYDDDDLYLDTQLNVLKKEIAYFPVIEETFEKLRETVKWLQYNPANPKREALHEKLKKIPPKRDVGVVAKLTRGRLMPGWEDKTFRELHNINPKCVFLASISDIKSNFYEYIVLPSAGGACPMMRTLLSSFTAKELSLIYYDFEKKSMLERKTLPQGTLGMKGGANKRVTPEPLSADDTWSVDNWVDDTYWQRMRNKFLKGDGEVNSHENSEFLVRARLVTLGNSKTVVLREDHRVIEISSLIEKNANIEDFGRKFPRISVRGLKVGDLIVLRTAGSGDTLTDVAMAMMDRDGKIELLSIALGWKVCLKQTLQKFEDGIYLIAARLKEMGHKIRDPHYMWIWTTEHVIRPESKKLFIDLICILHELNCILPVADPLEYAEEKWNQMGTLIRYRMKAGRKIRELLLSRLRQVIEKGEIIGDEYHLSLVGLGGGELTVFRVSGVDSEIMRVPYSRTGIICEVEEQ